MFLIASAVGIIQGLYIDFYLCVALFCLFFIICLTLKIDITKVVILICCALAFNVYTIMKVKKYDTKYTDGNIECELKIISYKEETEYYDKYVAKNISGDKFLIYLPKNNEIKRGTTIHTLGNFALPNLVRNTGGFNFRRYLNSQGIYGNIFVEKYYISKVSSFNLIYYIQDEIYSSFSKLFPKNEMGLILGMMIGDIKDISDNILENFKKTGITHLVAVSGSNVAYVVLLVQMLFEKIIGKRATYFISIFILLIFMLISGASSSVVRATIMMVMIIIANILFLKADTATNISFSALVLMIVNPLVVYDVGFILSFGGTIRYCSFI